MRLSSIWLRKSHYPNDIVKNAFRFRLPEGWHGTPPLPQRPRAFRDPAGLYLMGKIGDGLRELGHSFVDAPTGYGTCDAICHAVRGDFKFVIALSVWREEGLLNCFLAADPRPVPWYRKRTASNVPAWVAACDDVAQVLDQLFGRDFTRYTADGDRRERRRRHGFVE
jgi:hypothetical protein